MDRKINDFYWRIKTNQFFQLLTVYLRYLIGSAFIIAAIGMGKLSGTIWHEATPIEQLSPLQQFFRVMSESGLYWQFIGWSQIIAGVFLITQRYAKIAALLFFGIILNIFIITLSYGFSGTPIVTGLMLLATCYLVLWDIDSIKYVFIKPSLSNMPKEHDLMLINNTYWSFLGCLILIIAVAGIMIEGNPLYTMIGALLIGITGFIVFIYRNSSLGKSKMTSIFKAGN